MNVDASLATETLIKYLVYVNGFLLVLGMFVPYGRKSSMAILTINFVFLLLRQGIKKESVKIEYRATIVGKTKEEIKEEEAEGDN